MKWFRRFWPYLLLVILIACNVTVWMQRDRIADWWRLRDYTPPKEIAVLAENTSMTGLGEHYFFINHPSLEDKEDFNRHCADKGEETAVLGCYHGNRRGIYLYAISDPRLEGVRQVTAAHEMLHQAYDRLSREERRRIDGLLQDFSNNSLANEAVRAKLDSYKKDGADIANEMHSIFGTEVRTLTPALEEYYKRYFTDRSRVVGYSEAYQGEFTRRKELVAQYEAQLAELKSQFTSNRSSMNNKLEQLKLKEKEIDNALTSGDRVRYEAAVADYNDTVNAYNAQLVATRKITEQYNQVLALRKEVALQEHELYEALDSSLGPEQQQQ